MRTQKITHTKLNALSFIVILVTSLGLALFFNVFRVEAATADNCAATQQKAKDDPKAVDPKDARVCRIKLTNAQARDAGLQPKSADNIVKQSLNGIYALVAIMAVVVIVLAGIRITTADGDASKVAAARQTIIYAVVGLVIVGAAFIITGIVQSVGTK